MPHFLEKSLKSKYFDKRPSHKKRNDAKNKEIQIENNSDSSKDMSNDKVRITEIINSIEVDSNSLLLRNQLGKLIIGSKRGCIQILIDSSTTAPNIINHIHIVDYIANSSARKGYLEFGNVICLFINCLTSSSTTHSSYPQPNQFIENGRYVTWSIQTNLWNNGKSHFALKISLSSSTNNNSTSSNSIAINSASIITDNNATTTTTSKGTRGDAIPTKTFLFIRGERNSYVYCGECRLIEAQLPTSTSKLQLVTLLFELIDYQQFMNINDCENQFLPMITTHNDILNQRMQP